MLLSSIIDVFFNLIAPIVLTGIVIWQPYPNQPGTNLNDEYNRHIFLLHILSKTLKTIQEDECQEIEPETIDYVLYRASLTCNNSTDDMFSVRRKGVIVMSRSPQLKHVNPVFGPRGKLVRPTMMQQCLYTSNNGVLYQLKPASQRGPRKPTYRFHNRM